MSHAPSTRLIVALTVLVPVVLVSTALIALVVLTSRSIEENLGDSLVRDTAMGMRQEVDFHFRDAVSVSDLYEARVQQQTLPLDKLSAWERPMYESMLVRPTVASICFANPKGEATYVLRNGDGFIAGRCLGPGENMTTERVIDAAGNVLPPAVRTYAYDAARRPWHTAALASPEPLWTPAYFWYSDNPRVRPPVASLGYTRAVRYTDGTVAGCLVVDVTLESISAMLQHTPLSDRGTMFIIDDQRNVLASAGTAAIELPTDRLGRLSDLASPDLAAAAAELEKLPPGTQPPEGMTPIVVAHEPARMIVEQLKPSGLTWQLVAVVRESSYLARTSLLRQRAVIIALLCSGVALALGLLLSRQFSRPIVRLAEHVRRAATGAVSDAIDINATSELNSLAHAVNQMTHGMREEVRLRAATEAAESANRAKTAFFTRVTHELRTPLNAIIGFSEMLEERAADHRTRTDLGKILLASNQLLRLINDLLDLAKIESGKMDVRVRDFAVGDVVEEACVLVQPLARAGKNTLRVLGTMSECHMRSDPDKLQQILLNLLGNAAKFTTRGTITLQVTCESTMISFRVVDTGPGISETEMQTLFDPFFQSQHASNQQASGTGLGLAICRQYARLLGGDITVESTPGSGAAFTLYLPPSVGATAESAELGSVAGVPFRPDPPTRTAAQESLS